MRRWKRSYTNLPVRRSSPLSSLACLVRKRASDLWYCTRCRRRNSPNALRGSASQACRICGRPGLTNSSMWNGFLIWGQENWIYVTSTSLRCSSRALISVNSWQRYSTLWAYYNNDYIGLYGGNALSCFAIGNRRLDGVDGKSKTAHLERSTVSA